MKWARIAMIIRGIHVHTMVTDPIWPIFQTAFDSLLRCSYPLKNPLKRKAGMCLWNFHFGYEWVSCTLGITRGSLNIKDPRTGRGSAEPAVKTSIQQAGEEEQNDCKHNDMQIPADKDFDYCCHLWSYVLYSSKGQKKKTSLLSWCLTVFHLCWIWRRKQNTKFHRKA